MMNDLREKSKRALDRVRVFDDSDEIALYLNDMDDYVTREACVHIQGLWKLTKQLKQLLSRAIKHINELEAQAHRKPLSDKQIALISVECAATHKHDDWAFARAIERAHGIGEQK